VAGNGGSWIVAWPAAALGAGHLTVAGTLPRSPLGAFGSRPGGHIPPAPGRGARILVRGARRRPWAAEHGHPGGPGDG